MKIILLIAMAYAWMKVVQYITMIYLTWMCRDE